MLRVEVRGGEWCFLRLLYEWQALFRGSLYFEDFRNNGERKNHVDLATIKRRRDNCVFRKYVRFFLPIRRHRIGNPVKGKNPQVPSLNQYSSFLVVVEGCLRSGCFNNPNPANLISHPSSFLPHR